MIDVEDALALLPNAAERFVVPVETVTARRAAELPVGGRGEPLSPRCSSSPLSARRSRSRVHTRSRR